MKLFSFILFLLLLICSNLFADDNKPDWSVVIYAAIDEEDLDHHAGEIMRNIENLPLPQNVELFFQSDDTISKSITRYIKRGDKFIEKKKLSEHNSASTRSLRNFMNWVKENATGTNLLLNIATHSWGWKGIIQDYTIPGKIGKDAMMRLSRFAQVVKESGLKIDILMLDCCVLGNVEPIEEFKNLAPFIFASQRETPYGGFPIHTLFNSLKNKKYKPKELARILPEVYAKAYSRIGDMAKAEGEFDIITAVSIDTSKWNSFTTNFKKFTSILKQNGFRERLQKQPDWFDKIADMDSNVDIAEFLKRVPSFMDNNENVKFASSTLLKQIGYPENLSDESSFAILVDPSTSSKLKLTIESDPHLVKDVKKNLLNKFTQMNQDLELPSDLSFTVKERKENGKLVSRNFVIEADVKNQFSIRPWMPGTQHIWVEYMNKNGTWSAPKEFVRNIDYFFADNFSNSSFLLSEAHTQGAPFIHGLGICLKPEMDEEEPAGEDPDDPTVKGPDYYIKTAWNKATGWGDLILLGIK